MRPRRRQRNFSKALIQGTAASGNQLLFKVGSALFSQSIELAARRLIGVPQRLPQSMPYGFASAPSVSPRVLAHADSHAADTGVVAASDWTNDGTRLIWKRFGGPTNNDVMVVLLSGTPGIAPVVNSAASENTGKLSPDGRWLAVSSDESGRDEVYIQPFPQGGRRWQVSRAGGLFPRWRADGRELFFFAGGDLSAAELLLSDHPRVGAVTVLFSFKRRPANVNDYPYAVTPDGQRFLVNVRSDEPPTVSILINGQAALAREQR